MRDEYDFSKAEPYNVELESGNIVDLGDELEVPEPVLPNGRLRVEVESETELNEVKQRWRGIYDGQRQKHVDAFDSVYWACVVFQSRAQLSEWLNKAGLMDQMDGQFIDGREVAKSMGIKLESPSLPAPKLKLDKKLIDLCG